MSRFETSHFKSFVIARSRPKVEFKNQLARARNPLHTKFIDCVLDKSFFVGEDVVVQIDKEHLYELEHLFSQSAKGIHLLFDNGTIAQILREPTESTDYFSLDNMSKVQSVLSEFVEQKSLAQKQTFLRKLPSDTFELLVRTYFNIVENAIFESSELRH